MNNNDEKNLVEGAAGATETPKTDAEKIAALEAQVQQLLALAQSGGLSAKPAPTVPADRIKIVHLVERAEGLSTLIKLSNLEIALHHFGEERTLSVQQFEELVGKYRSWFTAGMIAVHADYEEQAQHYGLTTNAGYPMSSEFLANISSKPMSMIEDIFPRLPKAGKDSLISYWAREARKGDKKFADIRKLETLNRLTDGSLTQLISEINTKNNK